LRTTYHIPSFVDHSAPKRGDLLQSNIGKRTERTWFILSAKELPQKTCQEMGGIVARRYKVVAVRWWELEPETRILLFRSAERRGGQEVHTFQRFKPKRKVRTFEEYMASRE
jgi:hypothetical protein